MKDGDRMVYIAVCRKCKATFGACGDMDEHRFDTAEWVKEIIEGGDYVERMDVDEARVKITSCEHKWPEHFPASGPDAQHEKEA